MTFEVKNRDDFNIKMPVEGIFNSSTDIFGLVSGAKKAAYLTLDGDKVEKFLEILNYFGEGEDFKIVEAPERDWIYRLDGNREKKHLFIGKKRDHLLKLRNVFDRSFNQVSHQEIGILLSYPSCCANRKDYMIDLENYFPENPYKVDFLMNNFYIKSDSNIFLFSHHPCSHQCEKTLQYAEKIYKWLNEFPSIKRRVERLLKMPVAYLFPGNKNHRALSVGVAYAFNGDFSGDNIINYSDVYYFPKFADDLTDYKEAELLLEKFKSGDRIIVEGEEVKIFKGDKVEETIENKQLIFINPQ